MQIDGRLVKEATALSRDISNSMVLLKLEDLGCRAGVFDVHKNKIITIDAEVIADSGVQRTIMVAQQSIFGFGCSRASPGLPVTEKRKSIRVSRKRVAQKRRRRSQR